MTTFIDGPAAGQHLMLHCSPKFLRVTCDDGKWDALDQPFDTPRPGERLFLYILREQTGGAFVDFGGKQKAASGFYPIQTYRVAEIQPDDHVMHDAGKWQEFLEEHK